MKFTGFWETRPPDPREEEVRLITKQSVDDLLGRLRVRLEELPSGTHIRIDLIVWRDEP